MEEEVALPEVKLTNLISTKHAGLSTILKSARVMLRYCAQACGVSSD